MKKFIPFLLVASSLFANNNYRIKLTHYCSCQKCCSWHYNDKGQPVFNLRPNVVKIIGQTASGVIAKQGVTLAMPKQFPFGTELYVKGTLLGICQDRGGAIKVKDNLICIDVYMDSHKEALKKGVIYIDNVENVNLFLKSGFLKK
jgi:3D (Asp-Asp-Asp) domain-containing protein